MAEEQEQHTAGYEGDDGLAGGLERLMDEWDDRLPFWRRPRFWSGLLGAVAAAILGFLFFRECQGQVDPEVLARSLEVSDISTLWVNKAVTPYEVVIVPSISLKVRNKGERALSGLVFSAVFRFKASKDPLGDGVLPMLELPLEPGGQTPAMTIRSTYGYSATSKAAFFKQQEHWQDIEATVFARTSSGLVGLGTWPVSREIEGYTPGQDEEIARVDLDPRTRELMKSVGMMEVSAFWRYKSVQPGKVVVVPCVVFRLENLGNTPLHHLAFRGRFLREEDGTGFTDGSLTVLNDPLSPGGMSPMLVLSGAFGYTLSSVDELETRKESIQRLKVRLFVRSVDTGEALLGTWPLERSVRRQDEHP